MTKKCAVAGMRGLRGARKMGVVIRSSDGSEEYPSLVSIWRSAVDATHSFLAPADREAIHGQLATDYFPQVELLVAERDGIPVAFAGISGPQLEMLFVRADQRGAGIGTALLRHAVDDRGVVSVDVNEQNRQAAQFYAKHGFTVVGRSDFDEQGRPYPLLHMRLRATLD